MQACLRKNSEMWKPEGIIFNKHHAQLPTVMKLSEDMMRCYYSTRIDGKSHIKFFDINSETMDITEGFYALYPGERGAFDHAGVMPSCIVQTNGFTLMYYTGWHLKQDVPYGHSIGVSVIKKDGTLSRISEGPILSLSRHDQYLVNSPCVEFVDNKWKMLYCHGTGWIDQYPTYNIGEALGCSAFDWQVTGTCAITHKLPDEAISRVSKDPENSDLYYSWRTKDSSYRISKLSQGKQLEVKIERSEWDSDMQCYPFIHKQGSNKYLFYNGNGYGATGIGVAKWKTDIT